MVDRRYSVEHLSNLFYQAFGLEIFDNIPLTVDKMHRKTGTNKSCQQLAWKTYGDLKYLMDQITRKVVAAVQDKM